MVLVKTKVIWQFYLKLFGDIVIFQNNLKRPFGKALSKSQ